MYDSGILSSPLRSGYDDDAFIIDNAELDAFTEVGREPLQEGLAERRNIKVVCAGCDVRSQSQEPTAETVGSCLVAIYNIVSLQCIENAINGSSGQIEKISQLSDGQAGAVAVLKGLKNLHHAIDGRDRMFVFCVLHSVAHRSSGPLLTSTDRPVP
jgi:hypothetical protein